MVRKWKKSLTVALFTLISLTSLPNRANAQGEEHLMINHSQWDRLLHIYVSDHQDGVNRFDYAAVTATDRAALDAYLAMLEMIAISKASRAAQMAYWINFYNALTVKVILDHYPVQSIRQIKNGLFSFGPWKVKRVTVEGRLLSLDEMEHDILRPQFRDPRIHYAVNCASWSCPNLMAEAYTAENLDQQLDDGARAYVNHLRGVQINKAGRLVLSSIYNWYKADFGHDDDHVLDHIRHYASPRLLQTLKGRSLIDGYDYDWTLNAPDRNKGDY